jgi:hypothetical protein
MYFATATPKGPVAIKISMEFRAGPMARLMGVQIYTGWDKVKDVTRCIQHPVNPTRVPVITYQSNDATQPDAGGSKH